MDRLWLLDTGCPVDLVQTSSLPPKLLERREPAGQPVTLETANGANRADQVVSMTVGGVNERIRPFCLPATPSVLSLGRRCRQEGYAFYWEPYAEVPTLYGPKGTELKVEVIDDVPYFRDKQNKQTGSTLRGALCGAAVVAAPVLLSNGALEQGGGDSMDVGERPEEAADCEDSEESGPGLDMQPLVDVAEAAAPPPQAPPAPAQPRMTLKQQAATLAHKYDHRDFNPHCKVCVRGRAQRRPHKRGALIEADAPTHFGDQVTGDSLIDRSGDDEGNEFSQTPQMRLSCTTEQQVGLSAILKPRCRLKTR